MNHNIGYNTLYAAPGTDTNININTNAQLQTFFNMIVMTIMGIVISSSTNAIPLLVRTLLSYFWAIIDNISRHFHKQDNEVIVTSTYVKTSMGTLENSSYDYDAVLFKINNKKINTKRVRSKANTVLWSNLNNSIKRENNTSIADYNIIHSDYITLSSKNDIRIRCNIVYDKINNTNNNSEITNYNIHIYSKKLIVSEIINKINKWKIKFMNHKKKYASDGNIYHYNFSKDVIPAPNYNTNKARDEFDLISPFKFDVPRDVPNAKTLLTWEKNKFVSTKNFDNVFFTDKPRLLKRLNYFLNNQHEYIRKGIPYTMGLLFYGEPGCGKTSSIKAISNYTKRHVVEINLKNIKTCKEFVNIFRNEFINDEYIPVDKRIIVLEDIDCMIDIAKQRNHDNSEEHLNINKMVNSSDLSTDDIFKISMINKLNIEGKPADDSLTLSCILNTIDGILEQNGRILIITTNYKDKLDNALLRPGRIDLKINFTKCTNKMTYNIIEHFYNKKISNDIIFTDNKYTPAEVVDKCFNNPDDMESVIMHCR